MRITFQRNHEGLMWGSIKTKVVWRTTQKNRRHKQQHKTLFIIEAFSRTAPTRV